MATLASCRAGTALLALASLVSCGPALPDVLRDAELLRGASLDALGAQRGCAIRRSLTETDLFGWDSGSRGKLKATAEQGLVVVHFEQHGCELSIGVLNCTTAKAAYRYTPRHARETRLAESDADLYAHFPVAVVGLRAKLAAGRVIRADYLMEGIDMMPIGTSVAASDLRGTECAEATHVVRTIHRGAFALAAVAKAELEAAGALFDASAKRNLGGFDGDGFQEACDDARRRGDRARGCDEPLRIELQEIAPAEAPRPAIPPLASDEPPLPAPPRARPVRAAVPVVPAVPEAPAKSARWQPKLGPREQEDPEPPPAASRPARAHAAIALIRAPPRAAMTGCASDMVGIPGGVFGIGATVDEDGRSIHREAKVSAFCLDRTEVTVAAYARCSTCAPPAKGPRCNAPGTGRDMHPQNCVSWDDAVAYCGFRQKRLPTDAEWEFAARWGGAEPVWPWGDAEPTAYRACWNRWTPGRTGTCPVASAPVEAFGLFDMAGNVREWVADWYGPFAPSDPRATPRSGSGRVIRGGAWTSSSAADIDTLSSSAAWPASRGDDVGFRCAQ
jgi:formylglycine-generating enzyme required for sulfatase activity